MQRAQATHAQKTRSGNALRQHTFRRRIQATRSKYALRQRAEKMCSGNAVRQHTLRRRAQAIIAMAVNVGRESLQSLPDQAYHPAELIICCSRSDRYLQTSSVVLPNKTLLFLHHDENQDVVFCNIILC